MIGSEVLFRFAYLACFAGTTALLIGGCSAGRGPLSGGEAESQVEAPRKVLPQQIQSETMSFADRYLVAMADVYDKAEADAKTSEGKLTAQRCKLLAAIGAVGNAVDPNPVVGMMDMALMVTLTREIAEEPWASETFDPTDAQAIVAALKTQETAIWGIVGNYLSPDQINELHQLADRWRREHPNQRYLAGARLADFPEAKSNPNGLQLANSVFGLIRLDPFTGLDPAVREVAEARVLAERMFFYAQRMPVIVSWQVDALYQQMLSQPQITRLLQDTTTVAGSTTQFTDVSKRFADVGSRFADVSDRFADTIEQFRVQLPEQQTKLVDQLNDLIATQRNAALTQATTQVSDIRDATVRQLNTTVGSQQDLATKNLQGVMDQSIDRLYIRVRNLVLIAAGSIVAILFIYRLIAMMFQRKPGRQG